MLQLETCRAIIALFGVSHVLLDREAGGVGVTLKNVRISSRIFGSRLSQRFGVRARESMLDDLRVVITYGFFAQLVLVVFILSLSNEDCIAPLVLL